MREYEDLIRTLPDDQREQFRLDDELIQKVRDRRFFVAALEDYCVFASPVIGPYRLRPLRAKLTAAIEWKPQDLWIGAFWKRTTFQTGYRGVDLWLCLIPCLPLHIWWYRKESDA